MNKIPTVYQRDPEDMRRVLSRPNPGCEWVLAGEGRATRKYDGTCVMLDVLDDWWARREVKPGKQPPVNFYAIETDPATGKTVGWEPIKKSPFAKFHQQALDEQSCVYEAGTYELCGSKINGNPEGYDHHVLLAHGDAEVLTIAPELLNYEGLKALLTDPEFRFEGIVWHHPDGRMAKLKVRDFGV